MGQSVIKSGRRKIAGMLPPILGIGLVFLTGCDKFNAKIGIERKGAGSVSLDFQVPDYLQANLDILEANFPGSAGLSEPEEIAEVLSAEEGISAVQVSKSAEGRYRIGFRFEGFDQATLESGETPWIAWEEDPKTGRTALSIELSYESYQQLEKWFPLLKETPLMQLYGPGANQDISENDYLDMIAYSFEETASEDLKASTLEMVLEVPGKVLSQEGGRRTAPNQVMFRIPVLDFLLLKEKKTYRIVY